MVDQNGFVINEHRAALVKAVKAVIDQSYGNQVQSVTTNTLLLEGVAQLRLLNDQVDELIKKVNDIYARVAGL